LEKIEIILTQCIKDIKSGRATLTECLNRYPSRRQELEPLLKVALNIQEPPDFQLDSSYKQVARARLLQQIRTAKPEKSRSFTNIFSFGQPPRFAWARVLVVVVAALIVVSMLGGGTVYAAQHSLPGELLYPVKTATEDVRLFFAGGSAAKAELNLQFAQTRLEEMSKLAVSNEERTQLAVNGYRGNLDAASEQIRNITSTSTQYTLLNRALENMQNQLGFCDSVIDANPAYLEPVREAGTLCISEQVQLLTMLAQQNNVEAAQINLAAMQNRLQRAQAKAEGGNYQTMQEVLLQYREFNQLGEQILQSAQSQSNHNTEIEELSLAALAGYLNTINSISQQVPQEYRNSVEACRQVTLQFQTRAQHRYQNPEETGTGQEGSPSGNGGGSTAGQDGQTNPQDTGGTGNTGNGTPNPATTPPSGTGGNTGNGTSNPATTPSSGSGGNTDSGNGTGPGGNTSSGAGNGTGPLPTPSPVAGGNTDSGNGTGLGGTSSGGGSGASPTATPSQGNGRQS
jgi:hypothetical protein